MGSLGVFELSDCTDALGDRSTLDQNLGSWTQILKPRTSNAFPPPTTTNSTPYAEARILIVSLSLRAKEFSVWSGINHGMALILSLLVTLSGSLSFSLSLNIPLTSRKSERRFARPLPRYI